MIYSYAALREVIPQLNLSVELLADALRTPENHILVSDSGEVRLFSHGQKPVNVNGVANGYWISCPNPSGDQIYSKDLLKRDDTWYFGPRADWSSFPVSRSIPEDQVQIIVQLPNAIGDIIFFRGKTESLEKDIWWVETLRQRGVFSSLYSMFAFQAPSLADVKFKVEKF
jgi:hypothetical protein